LSEPLINIIHPIFKKALEEFPVPKDDDELTRYIPKFMDECKKLGEKKFGRISSNQLGRINGDWFESIFEEVLKSRIGLQNFKKFGRGHKIKEINGFENVTWIPAPDIIIKNENDLQVVISLKWGLRHDRMYEVGYEAYAIKDWVAKKNLKFVKVFLFANDLDSGYEARLQTMSKVPALDKVYYLRYDILPDEIKNQVKSLVDLINELKLICEKKN